MGSLEIGHRFQFEGSPVFEVALNPSGVLFGEVFSCEACPLSWWGNDDSRTCVQFVAGIAGIAQSVCCPVFKSRHLMIKVVEEVENEP